MCHTPRSRLEREAGLQARTRDLAEREAAVRREGAGLEGLEVAGTALRQELEGEREQLHAATAQLVALQREKDRLEGEAGEVGGAFSSISPLCTPA